MVIPFNINKNTISVIYNLKKRIALYILAFRTKEFQNGYKWKNQTNDFKKFYVKCVE